MDVATRARTWRERLLASGAAPSTVVVERNGTIVGFATTGSSRDEDAGAGSGEQIARIDIEELAAGRRQDEGSRAALVWREPGPCSLSCRGATRATPRPARVDELWRGVFLPALWLANVVEHAVDKNMRAGPGRQPWCEAVAGQHLDRARSAPCLRRGGQCMHGSANKRCSPSPHLTSPKLPKRREDLHGSSLRVTARGPALVPLQPSSTNRCSPPSGPAGPWDDRVLPTGGPDQTWAKVSGPAKWRARMPTAIAPWMFAALSSTKTTSSGSADSA